MARLGGDAGQTQSMDLGTQLHSGIRASDIRICFTLNTFLLSHGVVVQPGNFEDVMNTLTQFLSAHPREAVFMRVKQEEDFGGNSYSFEQVFENFWSRYSEFFWHGTGTNPSLGEIRGKIVVLQDFTASNSYGIGWSSFNKQDNYGLSSNWDLYNKWTEVKDQLNTASLVGTLCVQITGRCVTLTPGNEDRSYINFLSGATGVFPYFVASGKSSPGTGAPLLATGKTSPGWKSWPDFPRVDCFIGICTIAFEGTNNLTYNYLVQMAPARVGIIMADFPGPGLIDRIVAANYQLASGGWPRRVF